MSKDPQRLKGGERVASASDGKTQAESALFRTVNAYPVELKKGRGSLVWDEVGNEYLDFTSGIGVTNLGHVPERVKRAVSRQLEEVWHVSNLFRNRNKEEAARRVVDLSVADAVYFCNSGAEANEAAIKLARRYHQLVLGTGNHEIVSLERSFHGRTLATLTATGMDKPKEGAGPLPEGFRSIPVEFEAMKEAVTDRTAAVILEPVLGQGGVRPLPKEFMAETERLCRERGALLIVDEVQTGIGRTGKLFAYEHYDIEPDVITLAKGLASGLPVGAMLAKGKYRDAFVPGSHGSTLGGNPIVMAAVEETLAMLTEEGIAERAAESGDYLMGRLRMVLTGRKPIEEVRGKGLMIGIACDRPVAPLIEIARKRGLLAITAGPNVIQLLPNLLVSREEMDRAVLLLASAIDEWESI